MAKVRIHHFREMKQRGEKITMLTAYDFPTARAFDAAGVDVLLVGDSVADNILGYDSTVPLTIDEMIPFARAVARGAERAFVVADLPFGSYEASAQQAVESAVRLIKLTGAQAVKFEGGRRIAPQVKAVTDAGIPFMGHLGFTPQSENALGGRRIQGRGDGAYDDMLADALALQEAGAFAIVLEMVVAPVAEKLSARHSHHRHRRRPQHGRTGARVARRCRRWRLAPVILQAVRRGRPGNDRRRDGLRRRGQGGHVPGR